MNDETNVPDRPENVPSGARYDGTYPGFEWVLGDLDDKGERHGPYKEWNQDGVLHGECTYIHGVVEGDNINYHPDGSIASKGEWAHKKCFDTYYYRGPKDSPEPWPDECSDAVHTIVWHSRDGRNNYTVRYFDADEQEVQASGEPLPERPESVSPDARYFHNEGWWVQGDMQRGTNAQVGPWSWWDIEGNLIRKEDHSDDGSVLEIEQFEGKNKTSHQLFRADGVRISERKFHDNGKLFVERCYDAHKRKTLTAYWYDDGDLNHETSWFYNDDGSLLATRERRYPGYTAFEARQTPDGLLCEYFLSTGVCINRGQLNHDGKMVGEWTLFDEEGEIEVSFDATPLEHGIRAEVDGFTYNVGSALMQATYDDIEKAADPEFVKRVRAIEWEKVESCYGDASEIPGNLIAMTSPYEAVRSAAIGNIEGEVLHQGSVYEATALVLPFWIELLDHTNSSVLSILSMLGWIGESSAQWVAEALDEDPDEDPEEGKWRIGILGSVAALRDGWSTFAKFLDSEDPDVKQRVLALAKYADPTVVRPQLESFARNDPDPAMRAIAIEGISDLEDAKPEHLLPFFDDPSLFVRTSAALSMALTFGPDSDEQAVMVLGDALDKWQEIRAAYNALPFTDSHVLSMISLAIGSVRSDAAQTYATKLCAVSEEVDNMSASLFGRGLLALVFGRGELPFGDAFPEVLTTLANSKSFYAFNVNAYEVLQSWNLPREPEEILALVKTVTAGPDSQEAMRAFMHGEA